MGTAAIMGGGDSAKINGTEQTLYMAEDIEKGDFVTTQAANLTKVSSTSMSAYGVVSTKFNGEIIYSTAYAIGFADSSSYTTLSLSGTRPLGLAQVGDDLVLLAVATPSVKTVYVYLFSVSGETFTQESSASFVATGSVRYGSGNDLHYMGNGYSILVVGSRTSTTAAVPSYIQACTIYTTSSTVSLGTAVTIYSSSSTQCGKYATCATSDGVLLVTASAYYITPLAYYITHSGTTTKATALTWSNPPTGTSAYDTASLIYASDSEIYMAHTNGLIFSIAKLTLDTSSSTLTRGTEVSWTSTTTTTTSKGYIFDDYLIVSTSYGSSYSSEYANIFIIDISGSVPVINGKVTYGSPVLSYDTSNYAKGITMESNSNGVTATLLAYCDGGVILQLKIQPITMYIKYSGDVGIATKISDSKVTAVIAE